MVTISNTDSHTREILANYEFQSFEEGLSKSEGQCALPVAAHLAPTAIHVHMCCMYNKSAPSPRGTESDQNGRWSNEEGGRKER